MGATDRTARGLLASASTLALCFGVLAPSCGGSEDEPPVIGVAVWDHVADARLETLLSEDVREPAAADASLDIAGVENGVARLTLRLRTVDAEELPPSPGRRLAFELPAPALDVLPSGAPATPGLSGAGLPPGLANGRAPEGWEVSVSDEKLFLAFPADVEFPAEFDVAYRARAARLFGRLDESVPLAEVVRGRLTDRNATAECLFVPAGTRLVVPVPALSTASVFRASFRSRSGATLRVRASLAGESLFDRDVGAALAAGSAETPVRASAAGELQDLVIEVEGAPGEAAAIVAPHLGRARDGETPPNLLVLLLDTLRADRLGALGGTRELTPALDRLAGESLVFEESYSTCSWTLPSISTIFTSNHAEQHRARTKAQRLSTEVDTLAGVLRDAGYRTAAVTDGGMVHHTFGLDRGFATWDATGGPLPSILGRARSFLSGAGTGPWFLFVHTYEVHSPYDPPQDARDAVIAEHGDLLGGRGAGPWEVQDLVTEIDGTWRVPDDLAALLEALYDEEVRFTDGEVGVFLDELREDGTLDDTLVVVTSDHGEEFGDHGLLGHSDTLYREQLHVPLVLRFPPGSPLAARNGTRDAEPISHLDLAPSLVDALGLSRVLPGTTFDGRSVFSGLKRSPIWATRFHDDVGILTAVRDGDLVWVEGNYRARRFERTPEMYDLDADPGERDNLAGGESDARTRLEELSRVLRQRYGKPRGADTSAAVGAELEDRLEALGY